MEKQVQEDGSMCVLPFWDFFVGNDQYDSVTLPPPEDFYDTFPWRWKSIWATFASLELKTL